MKTQSLQENDIKIKDILLTVWKYKTLSLLTIFLFLLLSVAVIIHTEKVYTATSKFILDKNVIGGDLSSNASSQLRALTSISLLSKTSPNEELIERITSGAFVLEIAEELKFREDSFFNSYDPNSRDPLWKSTIKRLIGWKSRVLAPKSIIDWNILNGFEKHILIQNNKANAIEVKVDHSNPHRAAEIANHIVEKVLLLIKNEQLDKINAKFKYLSASLANALQEYESAQEALKQFTLENGPRSLESFSAGSYVLENLRLNRIEVQNHLSATSEIQKVLRTQRLTASEYLNLRQKFPVIDQAAFRRILGVSEIVTAWTWPSDKTVSQVQQILSDRLASLDAKIQKNENDASKYASSAKEYVRLNRELKIAEATHTVLLEQVKGHSLITGFNPDDSKIIALAEVPIAASKPNEKLVLSLGLALGLFAGVTISLVLGARSGFYPSRATMLSAIEPEFSHKIGSLGRLHSKNLHQVEVYLDQKPMEWARQVILETFATSANSMVVVIDTTGSKNAGVIGKIIGVVAAKIGHNVAFVDLSIKKKNLSNHSEIAEKTELSKLDCIDGCTEYGFPSKDKSIEWLFTKSFNESLANLHNQYDAVILSAETDTVEMLTASQVIRNAKIVTFVKERKTKSTLVERILNQVIVKVALHG